ncbi:hypothetical protein ONS95_011608 [Cadophora gregata]|uniref:uncharacterized protein n=1 Tax=Cadophora gregata TaxID=51156 RepID=UPI0026DD27FD|nr:uncharacterized protein ONS95_011608 [Cadophora gregata]KAK0120202.1 hypothetical protein ONS95_011608 [Cadophora gregata]KAK0121235.1 hypothetical protein ONS96_011412 [Cadophora gregata f. sp. sojae]
MCRYTSKCARCARNTERDMIASQRRPIIIKTPLSMLIQYIIDSRAQKRAALQHPCGVSHEPVSEVISYTYPKPQELKRLETLQGILGQDEVVGMNDNQKGVVRMEKTEESRVDVIEGPDALPRYSQVFRE